MIPFGDNVDQLKLRLKVISDPEVDDKPRKRTSKRKHWEIKELETIREEEKSSIDSSKTDSSAVETKKKKSTRKRVPSQNYTSPVLTYLATFTESK